VRKWPPTPLGELIKEKAARREGLREQPRKSVQARQRRRQRRGRQGRLTRRSDP
jgi:hypothetical protein